MKKIIFTIFVFAFTGTLFCYFVSSPQKITIFYTGEVLGELEPCGCSGQKTGGMVQRSSWIVELKKKYSPFFMLDGGFVAVKENRQQEIKFAIYHEILDSLNYHFRCFPKSEQNEKWKTSQNKQSKHFIHIINNRKLIFVFCEDNLNELNELLNTEKADTFIIMTKNIMMAELEKLPLGDFWILVLVNDAQEPMAPREINNKTIVMSAGSRGRYAGVLEISYSDKNGQAYKHEHISLTEEHQKPDTVVNLMEKYKQQVQEENLLDFEIKRSSPIGFVGSEMCGECHATTFKDWQKQGHSKAFVTLQKQKYHHDPECIPCHVVGYEFAEGYRNFEESDYLIHVGCESCHGPGAGHAFNPMGSGEAYGKTQGEESCTTCHQKDHSPHFDYAKYKQKIKHWD